MNKGLALIAIGIVFLIIVGVGWYLASPLLIDNTVNEEFPFELSRKTELDDGAREEQTAFEADSSATVADAEKVDLLSSQDQQTLATEEIPAATTVMVEQSINEIELATVDDFAVVAEGQFAGTDSFHQGSGQAMIYQNSDQRVLRFEEFSVTNGPDLHVILSKHPAPSGRSDIGEDYIDLGSLKGNIGSQNYDIPDNVDLSEYESVVIYCVPFHVVFATAALN